MHTAFLRHSALPLTLSLGALLLTACGMHAPMVKNADLPEAVRVPAGHTQSLYAMAAGELTYECRTKKDMADAYEWGFVGPVATMTNASGDVLGKYYAGPTWESKDGSKVTGKQVAVSPGAPGAIPLQLVKANPSMGEGSMKDVTYIQRLNTVGGVAPALPCGAEQKGQRQQVAYKADYVFYKASM